MPVYNLKSSSSKKKNVRFISMTLYFEYSKFFDKIRLRVKADNFNFSNEKWEIKV